MELKPFKAFRFNKDIVGDVGSCIAPPYDVIDDACRQRLYDKNEYNIVRVIKGKLSDSDTDSDNQYTRAAVYLNSWLEKGAVKKDSAENMYGYVQNFELAGTSYERFSFISLAKLEEFGDIVHAHEQILNKPIVDRLSLQKATSAKFGLIFMLYTDEERIADKVIAAARKQEPLIDFTDEQDVRHRLLAITGDENIKAICEMMADKSCVIADGHHRYTTGLAYAKENTTPLAQYQMMAFSNTCHEGLIVLATHRIASNLENFEIAGFITALEKNFEISKYQFDSCGGKAEAKGKMLEEMRVAFEKGQCAFGIYSRGDCFYMAVLTNKTAMDAVAAEKSPAWRQLDVSILHKLILEGILEIDEKKLANQSNLEYVKDTPNAIDDSINGIDTGKKQLALFMNPPKLEQIEQVANAGERMPQKATYFYPKVYTGLTINKL